MLKLIESQLGVTPSSRYLEDHKVKKSKQQHLLQDVTNVVPDEEVASLGPKIRLGGNPLELDEICNFSLLEAQPIIKRVVASSVLFDYSQYQLTPSAQLSTAFSAYGEGDLILTNGAPGNEPQLVALFPGDSGTTRRVLRVFTIQKPDTGLKLRQLEARFMPFSKTVATSYEAEYSIRYASLNVKFQTPSVEILSPPDKNAPSKLVIRVVPYSTQQSPLITLKSDLDRVKRLVLAYQEETKWAPLGTPPANLEEAISKRLHEGHYEVLFPPDQTVVRELDSAERMWEALKDAPDRKTAREGFILGLRILRSGKDLLSMKPSDFTKFAKMARSGGSISSSSFDVPGLRMLIEVGIFKTTNDCLSAIHNVSPSLERSFVNANMSEEMDLETRLRLLHHLYRVACLAAALSTFTETHLVEKEIRPILMDMKSSEADFEKFLGTEELELTDKGIIEHSCVLPLILNTLTPDLWIMRLSAEEPRRIEKRLVYERLASDSDISAFCLHVLELIDTLWLFGDSAATTSSS